MSRVAARCVALAGAAVTTACSAWLPAPDAGLPIENLDTEPRQVEAMNLIGQPVGPIVEVVRGEVGGDGFALRVYRTADGFCSETLSETGPGSSCGALPGEGLPEFGAFGSFRFGGVDGAPLEVSGVVSSDAATVHLELADGAHAQLLLLGLDPIDVDAQAFVGFVPSGSEPVAIVARDGLGNVIGRVALVGGVGPPDGRGPVATPAAP